MKNKVKGVEIMKKISALLLVIVLALSLTGCMKFRTDLTVNKDGSGEVNYSIAINSFIYQMIKQQQQQDPLSEIRKKFEAKNYQVNKFNNEDLVGLNVSKKVADIAEIKSLEEVLQDANASSTQDIGNSGLSLAGLEIERGIFYNTYKYNQEVDMKELQLESTGNEITDEMRQAMLNKMDLGFTISLPVVATEHNATKVENGGQKLVWDFKPGTVNRVQFKVKLLDKNNMIILGLLLFLVIAAFIFFLTQPSKKEQNYCL